MSIKTFLRDLKYKFNRMKWQESLHHMKKCSGDLVIADGFAEKVIFWQGKKLASALAASHLKDSVKGEIHVIASGPSLNALSPDHFWSCPEKAFCVNGSIKIFEKAPQGPRFYMATDTDFLSERFSLVKMALEKAEYFITSGEGFSVICAQEPEVLAKAKAKLIMVNVVNRGYLIHSLPWEQFRAVHAGNPAIIFSETHQSIGFSLDPSIGIFCGKTVTYRAVQFAVQMGAEKVSIWGMDLGGVRFYNEGAKAQVSNLDKDYDRAILPAFKLCLHPEIAKRTSFINRSMVSRLPEEIIPKSSDTSVT